MATTQTEREYNRAYNAKRRASPEYREKQKEWMRAFSSRPRSAAQKARRAEQARAYAKAHSTRVHHLARWKAQRAILSGRLVREPCEVCGAAKVDAHHDDYSKPYTVRWLCRKHHHEHHANRAKAGV